MSIKKIMAAAAASVVAVSAMSVAASAVSTNYTVKGEKDGEVPANPGYQLNISQTYEDDIEISDVARVEVDISSDTGYVGGNLSGNLVEGGWSQQPDFEVTTITGEGVETIVWEPGEELNGILLQIYWINPIYAEDGETVEGAGTATISAIRLLDADGNDLLAAPAENPPADSTPDSTPDDTSKPNTNTGVEGVAAVVGVAVVAAGAMVVAKKRK